MEIKVVTRYQISNGREFHTLEQAEINQRFFDAEEEFQNFAETENLYMADISFTDIIHWLYYLSDVQIEELQVIHSELQRFKLY